MTSRFIQFLNDATEVVELWPTWKQNVLGRRDVAAIRREMVEGTPDTPKRVETIRQADETYRRLNAVGEGP